MAKVGWKNWIIYRIHDCALDRLAKKYIQGHLIDIGCGKKPYQELLAKYVSKHVGVDHQDSLHGLSSVDLVGSAYQIPVSDCSFDSAISTAVLEHLEEPELALKEAFRVLKPGGHLILGTPFIWHLHEVPRDFFRYSPFGLKYLFEKTGFQVLQIEALAGFWVTWAVMLCYYMANWDRGLLKRLGLIRLFGYGIQWIALKLDRLHRDERWAWMHMVVATKPGQA